MTQPQAILIAATLDDELPVFKGATLSEIFRMAFYLALVNLGLGVVFGLLIGFVLITALIFVIFGTFAGVWVAAGLLLSFKRGKPQGYVAQRIALATSVGRSAIINRAGFWSHNRGSE